LVNEIEKVVLPQPDTVLMENDRLLVEGNITRLMQFRENKRFEISAERKFDDDSLKGDNVVIAEVAIAPNASIIGRSIKKIDVRRRFGVLAIALRRQEQLIAKYTNVALETGDVLLVQGTQEAIVRLAENPSFLVVNRLEHETRNTNKAPIALAIMIIIITAASTGLLHISTAGFLGVLLMIITNCLNPQDIYRAVEWRVIFMIAFMMPLGIVMDDNHAGTARWLANHIVEFSGEYGPYFLLACLFIFTTLITEVMSNAAAVVLIAPIAISIAIGMNLEPHPFMMAVAIGASTTFLTPIGHQANVLVYGVGGYRFTDFTKVGLPLNILIFIVSMLIIPYVWPFIPLK
jgi:di/tricarboxylate transporter